MWFWQDWTKSNFDEECFAGKQTVCIGYADRLGNLFWRIGFFGSKNLAAQSSKSKRKESVQMRIDGWIFMSLSWLLILSLFVFTLAKILRQKGKT